MTRATSPSSAPVVTGIGTINALGGDVPTFWRNLLAGACGIRRIPGVFEDAPEDLMAAAAPDPRPPVGPATCLSRTDRLALTAAIEAERGSSLLARLDRARVAVVVGTTTGGIRETEQYLIDQARGRPAARWRLMAHERANTADVLAQHFGVSGPRFTLHTACASGASAIALGADLIRGGLADAVLAGGSDSLARLTLSGFRSLRLLDPEPCRPFDRHRKGLSIGEGAGILVLEREEAARAGGVDVLAELPATGQTTDAHHLTAPSPEGSGAARAITMALVQAVLPPESVDHVNGHGTGTPANDLAEAQAIRTALGGHGGRCPVTSIKGSIGHTLGAAGAIEAISAILTLAAGLIPPTVGLCDPDPELGLDLVRGGPRRGGWRVALSNSFGFGGANTVLCFRRP